MIVAVGLMTASVAVPLGWMSPADAASLPATAFLAVGIRDASGHCVGWNVTWGMEGASKPGYASHVRFTFEPNCTVLVSPQGANFGTWK
jgi:hypothetical protein